MIKRCPTDASKYAGQGATIFFTGLLAAISSGYAFNIVFNNVVISIVLGLIWGLMIFNLDRYIVLSMRKSEKRYVEWLQAIPRVILAILFAVVISKPLEMKIFDTEIATELSLLKEEIARDNRQAINDKYTFEIDSLKNQSAALETTILEKEKNRDALAEIARKEADGTGGSGKVNPGPIYQIKKAQADRVQQELDELKSNLEPQLLEINTRLSEISNDSKRQLSAVDEPYVKGLSFRLLALDRLAHKYPTIYWADWGILLLFICIELSPIITKLISPRGPYDDLLEVREHFYANYKSEMVTKSNIKLEHVLSKL